MQRRHVLALVGLSAFLVAAVVIGGCGGHSAQAVGPPIIGPTGGFVGAAVCEACHKSQYANWTGTAHADALSAVLGISPHLPALPHGWQWQRRICG